MANFKDTIHLATIFRQDNPIMLCRNIHTGEYEFFNYDHSPISPELNVELKKVYFAKKIDAFFMTISDHAQEDSTRIEKLHKLCEKYLNENIEDLDLATKSKIRKKLFSLQYKHASECESMPTLQEQSSESIPAFSIVGENTIYYYNDESLASTHNILHEVLHCTSASSNGNICGFTHYESDPFNKKTDQEIMFSYGEALTEGATEYYATSFLDDDDPYGYTIPANIYATLLDYTNPTKLKKAFFTGDYKSLYNQLVVGFRLSNNEIITKLILQLDAFNQADIAYNTSLFETDGVGDSKLYEDCKILASACYCTLLDMIIQKHTSHNRDCKQDEKFDLENAKIFDLINYFGLYTNARSRQMIEDIIPSLEVYYNCKVLNNIKTTKCPVSDTKMRSIASKILLNIAKHKKLTSCSIPEECKTPEFYALLLSSWEILYNSNPDEAYTENLRNKLFTSLFSEKCGLLPDDINARQKLVLFALTNEKCVKNKVHKYISPELLCFTLNSNISYSIEFFKRESLAFISFIRGLDDKIKTHPSICLSVLEKYKTHKPDTIDKVFNGFMLGCPAHDKKYTQFWKQLYKCVQSIKNNKALLDGFDRILEDNNIDKIDIYNQ